MVYGFTFQNSESMHSIKFSHPYRKLFLHGQLITRAKLLLVEQVRIQDLTAEFLEYDTDGGKYKLPARGNYIRLTFLKPCGDIETNLFTTLRPATPGKEEYYKAKIGELFQIELVEAVSL